MNNLKNILNKWYKIAFISGVISKYVDKLFLENFRAKTYQISALDNLIFYLISPCFWFSTGFLVGLQIIHFNWSKKTCRLLNICGVIIITSYIFLYAFFSLTNNNIFSLKMLAFPEFLVIPGILIGITEK